MSYNKKLMEDIVGVCRHLYEKGFVSATDGNVSVRLETGTFLTTPTGVNKGMVTEGDLIEVDSLGNVVAGKNKPSTELAMHLYIYTQRPEVNAVVHAHPTYATGFAAARQPLTGCLLPEVIVGLGAIPLAEYATPSTDEIIKSIEPFVKQADAILLANHGVVTYGSDLLDAYFKMEKVEHAAKITFIARVLGGEKLLTKAELEKLQSISIESYGKNFSEKPACQFLVNNISITESESDVKNFIRNCLNKE